MSEELRLMLSSAFNEGNFKPISSLSSEIYTARNVFHSYHAWLFSDKITAHSHQPYTRH